MTTAGRRGILAVVLAVALLAVGAALAAAVSGAINAVSSLGSSGAGALTAADMRLAWMARALLVLALAWIVIGVLSARTSLVRRPGAAAARASWLAVTRPWRARESTLGMLPLDRWMLLIIPVALLIATRAVQTSLNGWIRLSVIVGGWLVFAFVLRLVVRRRSPWPVIAAIGGAVVLRCAVTLVALSFSGPGGYWYAFWNLPAVRGLYATVSIALFGWALVAAAWSLFAQLGVRRGVGAVICAAGAAVAVPAVVIGALGLQRALTVWDDRSGLMPWGLGRIVGITLQVHVPDAAVWWVAVVFAAVGLIGLVLATRADPVQADRVGTHA